MLNLPSGYSPTPGGLSLSVRSQVHQGMRINAILKAAKSFGKRVTERTVRNIVEYWRGTQAGASNLQSAKGSRQVGDFAKSARGKGRKTIRIGYTIEFFNPTIDDEQTYGGYLDLPASTTKEQATQQILNQFVTWLLRFYEYKRISPSQLQEIANSIEFKSLEYI